MASLSPICIAFLLEWLKRCEPWFTLKVLTTDYTMKHYQVETTEDVEQWLLSLDKSIRARIFTRIARLRTGNFGDTKELKGNLHELRMMFGAGYRLNFTKKHNQLVLLLCGGDKKTQQSDIKKAKQLMEQFS